MKKFCLLFLFGIVIVEATTIFASPPINDNFANRIPLIGNPVSFTGTLANATIETNEFQYAPSEGSVWWSWTPTQSVAATFEVLNFSTNDFKLGSLEVWTGTNFTTPANIFRNLSLNSGRHPFLTFSATAGTNYYFRVLGPPRGDFRLKMTATNAPLIMVHPLPRTALTNQSAFFGVVTAGIPPLFYQWLFNGTNISGETFPILSLDTISINQSGNYSVIISNQTGVTTSDPVALNVITTILPPQLTVVGSSSGMFFFKIVGEQNRLYRTQSSTDFSNWSEEMSFPKQFIYHGTIREKNGLVYNHGESISVPQSSTLKFYRTLNYSVTNEVCINNLAKMRFAMEIWTLENRFSGNLNPSLESVAPYLKGGIPLCPLDTSQCAPCSYGLQQADKNPFCKISLTHILEQPEF